MNQRVMEPATKISSLILWWIANYFKKHESELSIMYVNQPRHVVFVLRSWATSFHSKWLLQLINGTFVFAFQTAIYKSLTQGWLFWADFVYEVTQILLFSIIHWLKFGWQNSSIQLLTSRFIISQIVIRSYS